MRSCNASGKTFTAAGVVHWWLCAWDDAIVITTAPTGRQVKEVLWREIRQAAVGKGLYPPDAVLQTQINLGEKWFAMGLATDEQDKFHGYHSPHLLVVIDEASGISQEIYQAIDGLKPTRILLLGNPMTNSGRFADDFRMANVAKIHISAFDTPNVKEGRVVIPGLITLEDVERIKIRYGEDSDVYRVRVGGEFPKTESDTLISIDEVSKAMEREVAVLPQWEKDMGVDVARFGDDRSVITVRQMEKVIRKEVFSGLDTLQIASHVMRIAKEEKVLAQKINIDGVGIGAGVVDQLKAQGWPVNDINVGMPAEDTEHYLNIRIELFDRVKQWLKTAQLPKGDDYYELANIKYHFTSKNQLQLESKEDMKKRGLESPDVADSLALTFIRTKRFVMPEASPVATNPYYPEIGI